MRQIKHCGNCGGWFEYDDECQVSCTVHHSRGSCCHYGETPMSEPAPAALSNTEEPTR